MGRQIRSLLMATVVLSMTACGGGGGDDAGAPTPREGPEISRDGSETPREGQEISKARLIEQADAICRQDQERLVAKLEAIPPLPEGAGRRAAETRLIAPIFEANEETIRTGAQKIEALGRPSTDADLFDEYLDERTTAANALRGAVAAIRDGDAAARRAAFEIFGRNQAQALAIRFGFKVCGLGLTRARGQPRP